MKIILFKDTNSNLFIFKTLKLYGWEDSLKEMIQKIRENELRYLIKSNFFSLLSFCLWNCSSLIVSIISFAYYIIVQKNTLDASTAFVRINIQNFFNFNY